MTYAIAWCSAHGRDHPIPPTLGGAEGWRNLGQTFQCALIILKHKFLVLLKMSRPGIKSKAPYWPDRNGFGIAYMIAC